MLQVEGCSATLVLFVCLFVCFLFSLFCVPTRIGVWSMLQYSHVPSFRPKPSEHCGDHTVHSSGQLSSPVELHLSGCCYLSEPRCPPLINPWSALHGSTSCSRPYLLAQALSGRGPWTVTESLLFEWIPFVCGRLFLSSPWFFTQSNSLTSPETIWVTACHGPTLTTSPGVTQLPSFLSTVPASNHSPSLDTPPAVSLTMSSFLQWL